MSDNTEKIIEPKMRFDAFMANVKDGGLRSVSSIYMLVCYIVANMNNRVSAATIIEAVDGAMIANYFEISVESLVSGDERQKEKPAPGEGSGLDADVEAKAHTILDKLSKLPTKQQEAFLNSLDISIDAALNMMDGNGNG